MLETPAPEVVVVSNNDCPFKKGERATCVQAAAGQTVQIVCSAPASGGVITDIRA
jgi:hypothetical protein